VLGTVKNITVSQSCGKWFVSIQTEREVEQPVPQGGAVGIDMGVARFATLSDGTFYAPLGSFKRHEAALRKAQQALSHKKKFSNNWKKAKAKVQKIHARIANVRRDFLHKISTAISKNHALVCIEDLQVRNMSKSAAGTADAPGRNVRAKSGLNKSILDQAGTSSAVSWTTSSRGTGAGVNRGAADEHQPHLSVLRSCLGGKPPDTGPVRVRGMRFQGRRRSGRRDQCTKGGARPVHL